MNVEQKKLNAGRYLNGFTKKLAAPLFQFIEAKTRKLKLFL